MSLVLEKATFEKIDFNIFSIKKLKILWKPFLLYELDIEATWGKYFLRA
jgi:hypothetical protein